MRTIAIDNVQITPDRQRQEGKSSKDVAELKKSILSKGLLHPPVLTTWEDETGLNFELLAGERRLIAIKELHADGLEFYHDGEVVPRDETPFTRLGELSADMLEEAELEENVLRAALTWQEEASAKIRIHELRVRLNPNQTMSETAREFAQASGDLEEKNQTEQASAIESERLRVVKSKAVMAHMHNPEIARAKDLNTAYHRVLDQNKAQLESELLRLKPSISAHKVILGDCIKVMPTLTHGSFDAIISDPPYGISADQMKKEVLHLYDDSPSNALEIYQQILRTGFQLLKPQGTIFLFCDIEHFITIRTMAERMAYSTWRTPVIWHKGNEGHAPWGKTGFTRTYETILYCVKGQRSLVLNGGPDVRLIKRSTTEAKSHAAEKPPELLRWLLEISCRRGDKVLDPCAGTGSILPAAKGLGVEITAIELNETYYKTACSRLIAEEEAPESVVSHKKVLADFEADLGLVK